MNIYLTLLYIYVYKNEIISEVPNKYRILLFIYYQILSYIQIYILFIALLIFEYVSFILKIKNVLKSILFTNEWKLVIAVFGYWLLVKSFCCCNLDESFGI